MIGPGLVLLAQATLVTVPPGLQGECPKPSDVEDALRRHVPAAYVDAGPQAAEALRLGFLRTESGGTIVTLVDATGRTRLVRELPAPAPTSTGEECRALAESVGFIVQRYIEELRPLPSVPPPGARPAARFDLFLLGGLRQGVVESGRWEGAVGVAVAAGRFLIVTLSAGLGLARTTPYAGGRVEGRRIPVALAMGGRAAFFGGELQAGLTGGFDMLQVSATPSGGPPHRFARPGPFLGCTFAYRRTVSDHVFFRPAFDLLVATRRYEFRSREQAAFSTPRIQGRVSLAVGFSF